MSLAIFYGSTTGNTQMAAEKIHELLGEHVKSIYSVDDCEPEDLLKYDVLLLGIPTWDVGQLQMDWEYFLPKLSELNFEGKKIGLFGMGDSEVYSLNFLDALGLLWNEIKNKGNPKLIGIWPTEGYEYDESLGLYDDDNFLGLGLDDENQAELHDERIEKWVTQIKNELSLTDN